MPFKFVGAPPARSDAASAPVSPDEGLPSIVRESDEADPPCWDASSPVPLLHIVEGHSDKAGQTIRAAVTLHAIIIPRESRCGSYDRTHDHGLARVCEMLSWTRTRKFLFLSASPGLQHYGIVGKQSTLFPGRQEDLVPLSLCRSGPATKE